VLAKLRFTEAISHPEGLGGTISARQAAAVLNPLRTALRSSPSYNTYSLLVGVWSRCEERPSEEDLDEMAKAVALYPRGTDLAYNLALLCSQCGYQERATSLVDKALVFAVDETKRGYLMQLRQSFDEPVSTDEK
jgi:hypothetical protein